MDLSLARTWTRSYRTAKHLHNALETVVKNAAEESHNQYQAKEGDKEALKEAVFKTIQQDHKFQELRDSITEYDTRFKQYSDELRQLRKIENGQGLRNAFWRGVSTFVVAGVIFFFYWLAGCIGIQL